MVGSLWEWVGDWGQYGPDNGVVTNGALIAQPAPYNADVTRSVAGASWTRVTNSWVTGLPAALIRGGTWADGTNARVFAFAATDVPSYWGWDRGFRCARQ